MSFRFAYTQEGKGWLRKRCRPLKGSLGAHLQHARKAYSQSGATECRGICSKVIYEARGLGVEQIEAAAIWKHCFIRCAVKPRRSVRRYKARTA